VIQQILSIQNPPKQTTREELEKEIDLMVYKLYSLTAEEAKINDSPRRKQRGINKKILK
jgi:hypothetical protein